MLVTHILKGFVFVCQSKYLNRIHLDLRVLLCIRSDNVGVHSYLARPYSEKLVKKALISLVHTERAH